MRSAVAATTSAQDLLPLRCARAATRASQFGKACSVLAVRHLNRIFRPFYILAIVLMLALVAACAGSGGNDEAANADDQSSASPDSTVDTTTTSAGNDASSVDVAAELPAEDPVVAEPVPVRSDLSPADGEAISFADHIQPILERSCVSCHSPEQAGSDHVVLATAADAVSEAGGIATYVEARLMPPWPASVLSAPFKGDVTLSEGEITAVVAWLNEGTPLDVDPATPLVSASSPSFLEDPEIVMTSSGGAYAGDYGAVDDYRCLVFEPGTTEQEWIVGSHFVPDVTEVVHHGIITLASKELRDQAEWLDGSAPGPGWTCYGGTGLQTNEGGRLQRLAGWAPGAQPARPPAGYATALDPGDFVIVQIHYHYDGSAPADLSQFQLDLASDEEIAEVGGEFALLTGSRYLGPAEIPCYDGDTDPLCSRDAAVERVRNLYGEFIGGLPDYFLRNCGAVVEDFAAMTDGSAWSTCDLPVTNPGLITSVSGHMHELGASIRLTLNPGEADERILLDIPEWDFEWQLGYRPIEDIVIDRGDTIRVECAWNRENAPFEAVGYIVWSDGTGDEMCFSSITTAPLD